MDKYKVKLSPAAFRDLDGIYQYIAEKLKVPDTALNLVTEIENAILSLDELPQRGVERNIGIFANKGYRQIFVKNYTVVYRIDETEKTVIIITVRYSPSEF